MQILMMTDGLLSAVASGDKRITIRLGKRNIELGKMRLRSISGDGNIVVFVWRVTHACLSDIEYGMLVADGFENPDDAALKLKHFYPDITIDSEVTAIEFRLP